MKSKRERERAILWSWLCGINVIWTIFQFYRLGRLYW